MSMNINGNLNLSAFNGGFLRVDDRDDEIIDTSLSQKEPEQAEGALADKARSENEPAAHAAFIDDLFVKATAANKTNVVLTKDALANVREAEGKDAVDKKAFDAAEKARKTAQDAMKALDKFTGRQLAEAFLKDPERFEKTSAGKAFTKAVSAQMALADALENCSRKSGSSTAFAQLSMQANLRAAELSRLLGELIDSKENHDGSLLLFQNNLTTELARIGTDTESNRHALAFLEDSADIRLADLPAFGAGDKTLTPDQVVELRTKLGNLSKAIDRARRDGIAFGGPGSGRTMVDPAVFKALEQEIAAAAKRLEHHDRKFVATALGKLAQEIKMPDFLNGIVDKLNSLPGLRDKAKNDFLKVELPKKLKEIAERYEKLRSAIQLHLDTSLHPEKGIGEKEKDAARDLINKELRNNRGGDLGREVADLCRTILAFFQVDPRKLSSPEREWNLLPPKQRLQCRAALADVLYPQFCILDVIDDTLEHWLPTGSKPSDPLLVRAEDVRLLMSEDGVSVNDYIEARVHGFDDRVVDPEISGREPVSVEKLGSGGMSTAYLCTFERPGGETVQRVFKPESTALMSLDRSTRAYYAQRAKFQKALSLNMASHKVAEMFGAGKRVVKATIGSLNGQLGMFMEYAPGKAPDDARGRQVKGSNEQIRNVAGKVARELNQLQWLDLISGQLDRHDGNYHIQLPEDANDLDEVRVSAIDNDAAFPEDTTEIGVLTLSGEFSADVDVAIQKKFQHTWPDFNLGDARKEGENETFSYDLTKMNLDQRHAFMVIAGARNGTVPTCIDAEMREKIRHYANDQKGQEEFRRQLRDCKLTEAQIEAAFKRLQSADRYISDNPNGVRVVAENEWPEVGEREVIGDGKPVDSNDKSGEPTCNDYFKRNGVRILFNGVQRP